MYGDQAEPEVGLRTVFCAEGDWRRAEVEVTQAGDSALPRHERRLDAEISERYGPGHTLAEVSEAWRPYRTWAAVHLRALREQRTSEIADR